MATNYFTPGAAKPTDAGDIIGYTDRHLAAKLSLIVTFICSILALPSLFISLPIFIIFFLLAFGGLAYAVWQIVLSEITWFDIQKDIAKNRIDDPYY